MRLAATTTAIPIPAWSAALRAASSISSMAEVSPPNFDAYPDGSIWISSQPDPSAASSSAASRSSR